MGTREEVMIDQPLGSEKVRIHTEILQFVIEYEKFLSPYCIVLYFLYETLNSKNQTYL